MKRRFFLHQGPKGLLKLLALTCAVAACLGLGLPATPARADSNLASIHPQGVLVAEKPASATLDGVLEADSLTPSGPSAQGLRRAPATDTGYTDPDGKFYDHVRYSTNSRLGLGIAWTEPQVGQPTDIYVIANNLPAAASYRFDGFDLATLGTDSSGNPAWLIEDYIMDTSQFIYPVNGPLHRDPASPKISLTFTSSDTFIITVRVGPAANLTGNDRFVAEYVRIAITVDDPAYPSVHEKSRQLAAQAKAELGANASQYDLALWAHDWIIDHMDYDHDFGFCGAEGALTRGLGTCESYHRGLVMVLNDLGIETGRQVDDNHVWTLAKLDGQWCTIDATWDDTDYDLSSGYPGIPSLRHIYFGLDAATTALVHPKLEAANVPLNSLQNCHLIRSGDLNYFTDYEANLIASKLRAGQLSFSQVPRCNLGSSITNPIYHLVAQQLSSRSWNVSGKTTDRVEVSYAPTTLSVRVPTGLVSSDGHQEYWSDAHTQAKNQWVTTGGKRYYFDGNGAMATGWLTLGNARYYLGSDGAMRTGWQTIKNQWVTTGGKRYYFDGNGAMATGWLTLGNARYYLGSDGAMRTGWQTISGARYYFNDNGTMVTGWQAIAGRRYYFGSNGVMATGWLTLGNARYYLGSDGAMRTGWQTIDSQRYYFGSNGTMATGWNTISGKWLTLGNARYYLGSDGAMRTGWQTIDSQRYYFGSNGTMATGWNTISGKRIYFNSNGTQASGWVTISGQRTYLHADGTAASGWQYIDNHWYYLTGSGVPTTGWQRVGGAWYWLNANGTMATGWVYTGGAWYWMDGSGAMAANRWIGNYYVGGSGAMATNRWIGRWHVNGAGVWDATR